MRLQNTAGCDASYMELSNCSRVERAGNLCDWPGTACLSDYTTGCRPLRGSMGKENGIFAGIMYSEVLTHA